MFYQKNHHEAIKETQSHLEGLTQEEAQARLERDGYNELQAKKKDSLFKLIMEQFKDPLVIILLIAAGVQVFLGEIVESVIILAVVVLNAILGVTQTKKAEGSLESLKKLSSPNAKVLRNKEKITIPARELVVGDIIYLEAGDYLPADGRLIEAQSLKVVEGMLTGESEPVLKFVEVIEGKVPLGDQKNMVFSGSLVVYGRGMFVVTGTGMNTEMGKIAGLLETAEQKQTPLQIKLEQFSKKLGVGIVILSALIFAVQVGRGWMFAEEGELSNIVLSSFLFAVSIAVAAIPEALSSIVTIVLAMGTNIMAKRQAIIRKLPAVETLGSTSVICTDKTGTLTQNKMTVVQQYMYHARELNFGLGLEKLSFHGQSFVLASVLCNDSEITTDGKEIGDPTEVGLIRFALKNDMSYEQIRKDYPRQGELPFDSDRKIMSTVNLVDNKPMMFSKGAPDVIFSRCKHALIGEDIVPITPEILEDYRKQNEEFSNNALRVLALAMKLLDKAHGDPTLEDEHELVLIGLTAMIDPPREEVYKAIAKAKSAGIRTVMITGDHKTTAAAIGREIGLMANTDIALTGQELDEMNEDELNQKLESISVYARVSPENKIRIVRAWQKKEKVTAMTGDGVNDAPALKQADIGIGMGSGTEVAKDASAMILVDDNFSSIVGAVEIGRTVYSNIKKAITYLFAGNLGAIIAILFAVFANWANPFTAVQLLFINLVNDSLPAIALGLEPPGKDVMEHPPRPHDESILGGGTLGVVIRRGIIIGIATIFAQWIGRQYSPEFGTAMAFSTILLIRILQTLPARSDKYTVFQLGLFTNKYVLGAVGVTFGVYLLTLLPFVRPIFSIPMEFQWSNVFTSLGIALVVILIMEGIKLVGQRRAS